MAKLILIVALVFAFLFVARLLRGIPAKRRRRP
jgi:hypothetical protein